MAPSLVCLCLFASPPPDAAEILGFRADEPLAFTTLYTRDRPPAEEAAWTIRRVEVANAGGDRFVFGVHFAAAYPADNGLLILYVDRDADPATGRADHGCEFMLIAHDRRPAVTAYGPGGERGPAAPPRIFVEERTVWISYDLPFPQRDGRSVFRLSVLSEKSRPHVGVDHVRYATHRGPPIGARPKRPLPRDFIRSRGFGRISGLRRIESVLAGEGVRRIPATDAELLGFRPDRSEYRRKNVHCSAPGAEVTWTSPVEGRVFLGVILYDDRGKDIVRVRAGGRTIGYIVGIWDDRKQHLFFSTEPVALREGTTITLASTGDGRHRMEEIVLLPERPRATEPVWAFREIEHFGDQLAFITTWPAICEVETDQGARLTESVRTENHRFRLPGAEAGLRYRLESRTPEGETVRSGWRRYALRRPERRGQERSGTVPLRVTPPREIHPPGWPVTAGVPFPCGAVGSEGHVTLRCGGEERPLQTRVLSRWHDGSVRWLLCDFRHEGGERTYLLEYGPQIRRAQSREKGAPPEGFSLQLQRQDLKGYGAQIRARPEEGGLLRQSFHDAGHFKADDGEPFFHYEVRLHTFPGLPWLRAQVTVTADETCPEFAPIRSVTCRMRVAAEGPEIQLRQLSDDRYILQVDGSRKVGRRWRGPIGPIQVRDFWQNYPKSVIIAGHHVRVGLFPPLRGMEDEYPWAKGTVDAHRLFFWLDGGAYKIRQGMAKTHEIWLGLDGSPPPLDRPLMAVCPPAWYAGSGVFGEIAVADPPPPIVRLYDRKVAEAFEAYLGDRERNREYGLFNFGDWWGERGINWGNIEYDTQHALFLQFVRTGDLRFFRAAAEAELHNRDIDTVLRHRDPARIGTVYAHSIGHVGNYYAKSPDPRGRGSPRAGITVSHTWCEGHLDHYFFTGNRRSLEAARKIADHYDTYGLDGYDFTNTRVPGWHLILTLAMYRATREPFYLHAAKIIVERVLERQTLVPLHGRPPGGWVRMMVPGHCHCDPFHHGNAGFMVGILLSGLRWYHLETGDPRAAEAIVRGARFLIQDMWVPERTGFRYTSCPRSSAGVWSNLPLADGLAYAYQLSGDPRIADVLRRAVPAGIEGLSGFGKSLGQATRVAPHALGRLGGIIRTR